jgi:hypothetical protein
VNESPPPGNELTGLLWIAAALIALFELMWFLTDRLYSV